MNRRHDALALLAILVLCIATRLPLIFQDDMVLTGDECVVGLMAKHLAEGSHFSLYFYGQHYGLSIVESAAGAIAFRILGVGANALKLAMLALLLAAVAILFHALHRIGGPRPAAVGLLLFLSLPPWTEWSIQARGGYVTALLATACLISLIAHASQKSSLIRWAAVAFFAAVAVLAKASWLPALLPILLVHPVSVRSPKLALGLIFATGLIATGIHLLGITLTDPYWTQPALSLKAIPGNLAIFPSLMTYHFVTDLFMPNADNPLYVVCGILWLLWLPLGLWIQVRRIRQRDVNPWSLVFCLAVVLSLPALALLSPQPRYLLSVSLFMALWLAAETTGDSPSKRKTYLSRYLAALVLSGLGGIAIQARNLQVNPSQPLSARQQLEEFIELLDSEDIHHVYCLEALLQWQILFYSQEKITARWLHPGDRLPELPRRVDQAGKDGLPTAIVGVRYRTHGMETLEGITTYALESTPFFVAPNPTPEHLAAMGFQ